VHAFDIGKVSACGLAPIGLEAIVATRNLGPNSSIELIICLPKFELATEVKDIRVGGFYPCQRVPINRKGKIYQ